MGWLDAGLLIALAAVGWGYVVYCHASAHPGRHDVEHAIRLCRQQLERIGDALELQAMAPRPINEAFGVANEMRVTRTAMAGGFGAQNRIGEKTNEKLEAIAAELRKMPGR